MSDVRRIGFGGGCHWCTEAVFMTLRGVSGVRQGFIKSEPPNDSYSEAVVINFDTAQIKLEQLIEVHLQTHASASQHSMRLKYRSAIYTFDETQRKDCLAMLSRLQSRFDQPLVTQVLNHVDFRDSDDKYLNYYYDDKSRPFCRTYIEPKIELLQKQYTELLDKK